MNKFYDYLMPDMSLPAIGALVRYIRRFTAAMGGDIPVRAGWGATASAPPETASRSGYTGCRWAASGSPWTR